MNERKYCNTYRDLLGIEYTLTFDEVILYSSDHFNLFPWDQKFFFSNQMEEMDIFQHLSEEFSFDLSYLQKYVFKQPFYSICFRKTHLNWIVKLLLNLIDFGYI